MIIFAMGKSEIDYTYLNWAVTGASVIGIWTVYALGKRAGRQLDKDGMQWGGNLGTKNQKRIEN